MSINWQGVSPAVITRFYADNSINFDASRQMRKGWCLPLLRLGTISTIRLAGRSFEKMRVPRTVLPEAQNQYVNPLFDQAMANPINLTKFKLDYTYA